MPLRAALLHLAFLALLGGQPVTHGPILGGLTSEGVSVWGRTSQPGRLFVRYGKALGQLDHTAGPVATSLGHDNTSVVRVGELEPDTRYYYQLYSGPLEGETPENSGSFRTLPDAGSYRNPTHNPDGLFNFAFEFACGNNQKANLALPTFATMLREIGDDVRFAILNGDWLYEEARDYPAERWLEQVGAQSPPQIVRLAPTIAGVWENYKLYLRRGGPLRAWHRNVPSFFTFDDHEILGDVNGAGTIGLRSRRAAFRDIGVQAWYDYLGWSNPVDFEQPIVFGGAELAADSDILTDQEARFDRLDLNQAATLTVHWGAPDAGVNEKELDDKGGDPNAGVYEVVEVLDSHRLRIRPPARQDGDASYSVGRLNHFRYRVSNAELFFLDTRSHRQIHDKDDPFKEGVSMLGERQKAWLREGMADSDADFLFVVSSVNLMVPHVGPGMGGPNKDEAWTAIAAERNELIDFWDQLGKPVFVLTGDLHNSFAIKITDRVWEFASGPHNSGNHPVLSEAGRPPNGPFESRGKQAEIRWSTFFLNDTATPRRQPVYCVVRIQNVFPNPTKDRSERWVAYPRPQAIFQYYSGLTGKLLYAESILATGD